MVAGLSVMGITGDVASPVRRPVTTLLPHRDAHGAAHVGLHAGAVRGQQCVGGNVGVQFWVCSVSVPVPPTAPVVTAAAFTASEEKPHNASLSNMAASVPNALTVRRAAPSATGGVRSAQVKDSVSLRLLVHVGPPV